MLGSLAIIMGWPEKTSTRSSSLAESFIPKNERRKSWKLHALKVMTFSFLKTQNQIFREKSHLKLCKPTPIRFGTGFARVAKKI
jgi:hypothetical protein